MTDHNARKAGPSDERIFEIVGEVLGQPLIADDLREGFTVHTEPRDWVNFARALLAAPPNRQKDNDSATGNGDGMALTAGLREAADFVAGKADDYANEFGYGVGGTLCFDRQEKMDHYTTLTGLAEEIRVLAAPAPAALAPAIGGRDIEAASRRIARALLADERKVDCDIVASHIRALLQEADIRTAGWQPISTAPNGVPVVVGWLDPNDPDGSERHDFDCKDDGVWLQHADHYDHFCMVAPPGSRGPKEEAPYQVWMPLPPIPTPAAVEAAPDIEIEALFEGRAENTAATTADPSENGNEVRA